jgi:hypothetical protein
MAGLTLQTVKLPGNANSVNAGRRFSHFTSVETTAVFCLAQASSWSSCFSMFPAQNSLKAELQRVEMPKQKALRNKESQTISS